MKNLHISESSQLRVYKSTLLCENQRAYKLQFYITFFFLIKEIQILLEGGKGYKSGGQ
jgi:hypothetical protein